MNVIHWMTRDPVALGPDASIKDGAAPVRRRRVPHIPVVDRSDWVVGVVSRVSGALRNRMDIDAFFTDEVEDPPIGLIRATGVVRATGLDRDDFVEALWRQGHRVLHVETGAGSTP